MLLNFINTMTLKTLKGWSVHQWSERPGFYPKSNHIKNSKMVFDTSLLNTQHYKVRIIRYRSRVRGAIQGKEYCHPQHLCVVAIEKAAFKLLLDTVSLLTYLWCVYLFKIGLVRFDCFFFLQRIDPFRAI